MSEALEEAISYAKSKMKINGDEDEKSVVARYHSSLGREIRNKQGLWGGGTLRQDLIALGLVHPDDMSGLVLQCAYRDLKKKKRDIPGIVKEYKLYWYKFSGDHLKDPSAQNKE